MHHIFNLMMYEVYELWAFCDVNFYKPVACCSIVSLDGAFTMFYDIRLYDHPFYGLNVAEGR